MKTALPTIPADADYLVAVTLIVRDVPRSVAFYRDVFAATIVWDGEPTFLRLANIRMTISGGGGPTDDKPEIIAAPPQQPTC